MLLLISFISKLTDTIHLKIVFIIFFLKKYVSEPIGSKIANKGQFSQDTLQFVHLTLQSKCKNWHLWFEFEYLTGAR